MDLKWTLEARQVRDILLIEFELVFKEWFLEFQFILLKDLSLVILLVKMFLKDQHQMSFRIFLLGSVRAI